MHENMEEKGLRSKYFLQINNPFFLKVVYVIQEKYFLYLSIAPYFDWSNTAV